MNTHYGTQLTFGHFCEQHLIKFAHPASALPLPTLGL